MSVCVLTDISLASDGDNSRVAPLLLLLGVVVVVAGVVGVVTLAKALMRSSNTPVLLISLYPMPERGIVGRGG